MLGLNSRVGAMLLSASVFSLLAGTQVDAQSASPLAVEQAAKPIKRGKRADQSAVSRTEAHALLNARAQAGPRAQNQTLDEITVTATKVEERAIDALAPVSIVTLDEIKKRQATRVADLIYTTPGVWIQDRGDDPSTSINIRGLQDFGRVAVVVDGARQNYQRTGHNANGSFFLDQELIGGIDIVRGPTANIYGSGAIGGVVSFRTKDIQDVVRPGERWGVDTNTVLGTNNGRALQSVFGGVHINPNVDVFAGGSYSRQDSYNDGTGTRVENTFNDIGSAIGKITVRPADGHEVKLSGIFQDYQYTVGQPRRLTGLFAGTGTSNYATDLKTYQASLGWKYSRPDDKIFDIDAKIYWNRTDQDQIKTLNTTNTPNPDCGGAPGNAITGCVGSSRGYLLDTIGIDVFNTSRFETDNWRHAVTYGFDAFRDEVSTRDATGNSNATTPGGVRTVSGGFVQWKANYTSLFELVSAIRYDNYNLESGGISASGDRFSPKITLGILPTSVVTPYVSYAEGYRAPALTETVINGPHVAAGPFQGLFVCPTGTFSPGNPAASQFCFLPNPNLRPEVGKTKEIGFNVKKDGIFAANDSFRSKLNVFRNDISDYINPTNVGPAQLVGATNMGMGPPFGFVYPFFQYQNIPGARIEGVELESMYDAQNWFAGVAATVQRGKNISTGVGLYSIAPQKVTTTLGVRFSENKGTLSVQWTSVKANTNMDLISFIPGTSYDLLNFYATFRPTQDLTLNFSIENLLNQYYRPYATPTSIFDPQNDVLWASASPGIVFKGGMRYHFGGI